MLQQQIYLYERPKHWVMIGYLEDPADQESTADSYQHTFLFETYG